jgi:hypothetical protein
LFNDAIHVGQTLFICRRLPEIFSALFDFEFPAYFLLERFLDILQAVLEVLLWQVGIDAIALAELLIDALTEVRLKNTIGKFWSDL